MITLYIGLLFHVLSSVSSTSDIECRVGSNDGCGVGVTDDSYFLDEPEKYVVDEILNQLKDYREQLKEAQEKLEVNDHIRTPIIESNPQIEIKWKYSNGTEEVRKFDYVLIACAPEDISSVLTFTDDEKDIFEKLQRFYFFTTAVKADKLKNSQISEWVFFEKVLTGGVQGMREEYNARNPSAEIPTKCNTTYYTVYQETKTKPSIEELRKVRDEAIEDKLENPVAEEEQLVSYFHHFNLNDVSNLWKLYENQGKKNTFWISSVSSFESVLHIYQYGKLLNQTKWCNVNKDSKIAIIGAGPAGLLWAWHFLQEFENVVVLEKSNRVGGKTQTLQKIPEFGKDVVVELGTCYLSPAYDELYNLFTTDLIDNPRLGLGKRKTGNYNFLTRYLMSKFMDFPRSEWREFDNDNQGPSSQNMELLFSLRDYINYHKKTFGLIRPFSEAVFNVADLKKTFSQFLKDKGWSSLISEMKYGYQHQGYGRIEEIPAIYGLIWVTPELLSNVVLNKIFSVPSAVTSLQKGWGSYWDAIETRHLQGKIIKNVDVTKIDRSNVKS